MQVTYKIIILTFITFCKTLHAQTEKNAWIFGVIGNGFFYKDKYENSTFDPDIQKINQVNISTNTGYFTFDNLAVGIRVGINLANGEDLSGVSGKWKSNAFFSGPFVRYYFMNNVRNFNVLVDGCYQAGRIYEKNNTGGPFRQAKLMFGPEIFFNSSIGMEFLVGYMHQTESNTDPQIGYIYKRSGLLASLNFQIHLSKNNN
jgi:hypothetical protein